MFHFYLAFTVFIIPVLGVTRFDHLSRDVPLSDQMRGVMLYLRHTNLTLHTCYEISIQLELWAHENNHDCREIFHDMDLITYCFKTMDAPSHAKNATRRLRGLIPQACSMEAFKKRDLNLVEGCQRSLNSTNARNEASKHMLEMNLEACQSKGFLYTAVAIAVLIVAGVSLAIGYAIGSAKKKREQT
ncbi:hypothetical protein Ddc_16924 [Ditylenchus destructor]|nr:hypothetical protein Ddc_16924 [Ditylenchus destructor]